MVLVLSIFRQVEKATVAPKATFLFKGVKSVAVSSSGLKYYVQGISRDEHIFMIKRTNS